MSAVTLNQFNQLLARFEMLENRTATAEHELQVMKDKLDLTETELRTAEQ